MDYLDKDFGKILKNNAQTLRHDLLPQGTDCFRVYDRNLSRYPVTVDIYGRYAKVTDYGSEPMAHEVRESCLDICSRMLYLEPSNVVYSHRAKRQEGEQHEKTQDEAVRTAVKEDGLTFSVDLTTYVDTGLFLDHSVTRHLIRERSANADVLNLFSYTGSFSVYAAAGLANSVTSVDMSATYTKWAQENLLANGYSGDMYRCICMDATKFVKEAISKGSKYDIIIFDPPSFSNSHKMDGDFDVARDYAIWIRNLFKILKRTGFILFSTNLGTFRMDKRRLRGLSVKEITGAVGAPGFVKGRVGTVRSWMMAFDDDSLSLDWSEPEKKSEKGSDRKESSDRKPEYRRERRDGERRSYSREGDTERRERRSYDRGQERRRYEGDRPQRRDRDDRSSSYGRSDRYSHHDRYDDSEQRKDRYQSRSYDRYDRSERSERPRRYNDRQEGSDSTERSERPYRRDREDRPYNRERGYDRDRGYNRERSDRRPYGEKRDFNRSSDDRRSFDRKPRSSEDRPQRRERTFDREDRGFSDKKAKKPYGYDSFKPARSREDSTDFFWNAEDLDPKPKKEED